VGLGPVAEPPFLPAHVPNRQRLATSQLPQRAEVARADAGVPVARHLPVASPGGASNTSCRCSRAPAADLPKESLCAERTQCRSAQHGQASSGDLFATCDAVWEASVRSLPRGHHQRVVEPLPPTKQKACHVRGGLSDKAGSSHSYSEKLTTSAHLLRCNDTRPLIDVAAAVHAQKWLQIQAIRL
jgi:hypothetical protein